MKEQSAKVKASIKYNQKNVKQVKMNLNLKTDTDIIEALASCGNVQGYIKDLIRKDINDEHQTPAITKKIVSGSFQNGEFVVVEIDGKEFRRKVYYSNKHDAEAIIIYGNEYLKTEFQ